MENIPKLPEGLSIRDNIVAAALEYHGKPMPVMTAKGPILVLTEFNHPDDTLFTLRDSIIYRANCAAYHLNPLSQIIDAYSKRLQERHIHLDREEPLFLRNLSDEAMYVFDDITFHAVSLFDYASSFFAYPFLKSDAINIKWNSFRNHCDPKNTKKSGAQLSGSAFAKFVQEAHLRFVEPLQKYRASLYHNHKDFAPCESSTLLLDPSKSHVWIGCPQDLAKAFERHVADYPILLKEKVDIQEISNWLVEESHRITNQLIWLFRAEVNVLNREHFASQVERGINPLFPARLKFPLVNPMQPPPAGKDEPVAKPGA